MNRILTQTELRTRISDVFNLARICKFTADKLANELNAIYAETLSRTPKGKRRYSVETIGYARGYAGALYDSLWRYELEFCYRDAAGVLYSVNRDSKHATTEVLHGRALTSKEWAAMDRAHVWKGTDKPFTPWGTA